MNGGAGGLAHNWICLCCSGLSGWWMLQPAGKEVLSSPANRPLMLVRGKGSHQGILQEPSGREKRFACIHRDILCICPAMTLAWKATGLLKSLCCSPNTSQYSLECWPKFVFSFRNLICVRQSQTPCFKLLCAWPNLRATSDTPGFLHFAEISAGQMKRESNLLVKLPSPVKLKLCGF